MIDPVTRWSKVTQYDDKKLVTITNLVETMWIYRYPWPSGIIYGHGSEFLGN